MAVKVVLVDDEELVRERVRAFLDVEPDIEVVGEADDGPAAVRLVEDLEPDIVVIDVVMPRLSGIDVTRRIVASLPRTRVVALSMHDHKRFVEAMFDAGARAYVLKENADLELVDAIRRVAGEARLGFPDPRFQTSSD